ncbi:MAG: S8 family serine peptidase [Bacteroidetes bacterium]|nr:S8 family serine peptidase [Bacteroidota bacterium]
MNEARRRNTEHSRTTVRVAVYGLEGTLHNQEARVLLTGEDEETLLKRPSGALLYEGRVPPGRYRLEVTSESLVAPPRAVEVAPQGKTTSAYLGEKGWPFYRLGEHTVPFPPPERKLAVAFPLRSPDRETAEKLTQTIVERLPLERYAAAGDEKQGAPDSCMAAEGAVWLFRFTEEDSPEARRAAADEIRRLIDEEVRVGIPVDLHEGQVKVIDHQFVVRFRDEVSAEAIERLVRETDGRILRRFRQSPNARLIAFPRGDYRQHLETIESWYEQDVLVYGEPDIMAEIADDVFPDDAPNDPTYASQDNLTLQQVDVAWRILHTIDPDRTLGAPGVYVATLDRGIDLDHPDIGGTLTDGTNQIARCYDFSGLRECTVSGYAPDTDHGMGVYGIIAALTDNNEDVAGIAPNTHQIGMERPNLTSANYPDVLLWAAGFTTNNGSGGWPAEPLSPGADIISCSHGSNNLALSGIMDDTFQELATNGRGGLGTLVIYSAGNSNTLITGFRTWAAHPNTMAIANSAQPDGGGVERKVNSSNFGPEIDVCAQGAGAPSLDASGGEQTFGGTSAAAPTVAGIAALMLSVDSTMTWEDLRDTLRDTAVQIDAANTDPVGQWVGGFSPWYGFGRVNAASAVCGEEPEVTLQTLSLTFNDIPEGETTVRAAVFSVMSCQPVTLEIVSGPGADFDTPLGASNALDPVGDASPREGRIWIGYTGTTDGDTASGSVTIQWVETGQEWTVPITANTVSRPTVAIALVLDRSGSMNFSSGIADLPTRVDVLKSAVPPLLEVMHEDNALGVVSFDEDAHDVMPITLAGPPVFGAGRAAARSAVDGHTPNPSGLTAIGDGVARAHDHLAAETGFDRKSMIVLTDGHETAAQYIADIDHLVNERVYAIGLGTAETIQPAALSALTNATNGYLLLTGDLAGTDYFLLAKYYLQILAGVANEDVVLDPQGFIAPGQTYRVPFRLNEADISSDVILLSPAPQAVRFMVETPAGDLITPGIASGVPGVSFAAGSNVSYYRLTLPVPIGAGAAAGQWHALLKVDEKYFRRYLDEVAEGAPALHPQASAHGVRYSLNVHAYSNLRLRATLAQNSLEPGATLSIRAVLTEYGLPVEGRAQVQAELIRPDGTQTTLLLPEVEPGIYEAATVATATGTYRVRVYAHGKTLHGRAFTREQLVTGGVWQGGDAPLPSSKEDRESRRRLCGLLRCLLDRGTLSKEAEAQLRARGIHVDRLRRCIRRYCGEAPRRAASEVATVDLTRAEQELLQQPEARVLFERLAEMIETTA